MTPAATTNRERERKRRTKLSSRVELIESQRPARRAARLIVRLVRKKREGEWALSIGPRRNEWRRRNEYKSVRALNVKRKVTRKTWTLSLSTTSSQAAHSSWPLSAFETSVSQGILALDKYFISRIYSIPYPIWQFEKNVLLEALVSKIIIFKYLYWVKDEPRLILNDRLKK